MNLKILGVLGIIISIISIIKERKNYIILLLTFEIIIISITILYINTSIRFDDYTGIIYGLYLLIIGAIESALGLTLLIIYFKYSNNK